MKEPNKSFHVVVTEIRLLQNNPIYVSQAPAAPPLPKTPYVSVDQLQEFSVSAVYDYMRISVREGLQEG